MTEPQPPAGQLPIELILMRQVASYLEMPMLLVGADGELLFFNEPAGLLLGQRFEDLGEVPMADWVRGFRPLDATGQVLSPYSVSVIVALRTQQAAHDRLRITGLDGVTRMLETTAFPLKGQGGRLLGAVALFWSVG
ncbi:MAG: PAS domain-containing protein [Chloroflexota bacterium]